MRRPTTCPGCRLELPPNRWTTTPTPHASKECAELFGEVQGFGLAHLELARDFHQLAVDAYLAQHAPPSASVQPIGVPFSLVGLHLSLHDGVAGTTVRDIHRRMAASRRVWPVLDPPLARGRVTVFDVAEAGLMVDSVAGHRDAMRRWARSVWYAWAPQHAAVSALVAEVAGDHCLSATR